MIDELPAPIRVVARSVITWWDAAISLVILNLIWGFGCLTVVFGPPVTFGLYYVVNELVHGRGVGVSGLITGARRYFWQSWLWALPNIVFAALIVLEARFFENYPFFLPFIGIVVTVWLIVQFYGLPYFMEQETKNILIAWRNGLFTALASPFYTLIVFGCAIVFVMVSMVILAPLFFGGVCLIAVLGTTAVVDRIEIFGIRKK